MKLFERTISAEEAELLVPWSMGRESQQQAQALERYGYTPVFDGEARDVLKRHGASVARTHTDGALWIYTRCIPAGERYAVWALKSDLDIIDNLRNIARATAVADFASLLAKLPPSFTVEQRDAAEAIMRLGKPEALLQFLESL